MGGWLLGMVSVVVIEIQDKLPKPPSSMRSERRDHLQYLFSDNFLGKMGIQLWRFYGHVYENLALALRVIMAVHWELLSAASFSKLQNHLHPF